MSYETDILASIDDLPPMPTIATEIMRIVNDPDFDKDDLVRLVSSDPSLTTKVLGLCNSSLFGLETVVTTVPDAVGFLGASNIAKAVVSTCMSPFFKNGDFGYRTRPGAIWRHSVACGIAAQHIARRGSAASPGTAFTAGILHNIGKIALGQFLAAFAHPPRVTSEIEDFLTLERSLMGIDHCRAGGIISRNWGVPEQLQEVCELHHDSEKAAELGGLVAIVYIADELVMRTGYGDGVDDSGGEISAAALATVGIAREDLDTISAEVTEEFDKSEDLVKLDRSAGR